ncbi:hotdog fold thioesterase [Klebsiella quasipneumoniae subsp. quasipneumoniae]
MLLINNFNVVDPGQLFTLADTAFAYACNSQGLAAVASAASIDFLRPASRARCMKKIPAPERWGSNSSKWTTVLRR